MNSKLDILIEKYLDGNISKKDQTELNLLIESDVESKNSFHNADALQKLIKIDAVGIDYPEEFFSDVQDMILMKYLQEAPKESTVFVDLKNAYPKQLYTYARYAAAIVIFFLASIISINEFLPLSNSKLNIKSTAVESNNNDINNSELNSENNIRKSSIIPVSIAYNKNESNTKSEQSNNNKLNAVTLAPNREQKDVVIEGNLIEESKGYTILAETPQLLAQSDISNNLNDFNINQEFERIDDNNLMLGINEYDAYNSLMIQDINNLPNEFRNINQFNLVPTYSFGLDNFGPNKINFVASASNGFASYGLQLSNSTITSYSQSISYNIDRKSVIGVELGLTQFSAKVLRDVVLVTQNTSGSDDDFTGKDLIRVKLPLKQKMQLVWTTIFYERALFQMENTEISARLGLGLTDSDPVYMAKVLGKQRLFRDLFLTIGVDTRYYKTSINGTINGDYLSTFNIIYGLQYSL